MGENFTPAEIERYARHLVLPEIGGAGQQKLKTARVLVIGAGGLGSPVLAYLAAAGVGHLGLIDHDDVSLSNLQRQILYCDQDQGHPKTAAAERFITARNPHVKLTTHCQKLTADIIESLLAPYDIIVDASDNFATRYLLADYAAILQKPLVSGAIQRFDGMVTVLMPYQSNNPHYRDLFPVPPPDDQQENCTQIGVVGALAGIIGSLQALEVIKLITKSGTPLIGRLLLYHGLSSTFQTIHY